MTAQPLRCDKCGAAVPLIHAHSFHCPYCNANVKVSPEYKKLFEANALEEHARKELETRYAAAARVPSRRFDGFAIGLVLLGPAIASFFVMLTIGVPSAEDLLGVVIVPALLPGTILWMWSAAVHATVVRFQLALAAQATDKKGHPQCRQCGAPLDVRDDAIFSRCIYCGTDSLVTELVDALHQLDERLRAELKTIQDAIVALLIRRRLVIGGIAIVIVVLAALLGTLRVALHAHHEHAASATTTEP